MRMALAGHSEWVIQLFGRWTSATVLKYVRDALLGENGGNIAQLTEHKATPARMGMSIESVEKRIKESVGRRGGGVRGARRNRALRNVAVDQITVRVIPEVMKLVESKFELRSAPVPEEAVEQMIEERLEEVLKTIKDYLSTTPSYIMSYSGLKHVTLFNDTALCGWIYKDDKVRVIHEGPGGALSDGWCRKCARRHIRLCAVDA